MALRTLGDVLTRSGTCVSLSDNSSVRALAAALVKHHVDSVTILSSADDRLCGIATARDVTKCIARSLDLDSTNVSLVMTPNPITLPPTETPANALALMRQGKFRHIPVVGDDERVVGIVDVLSLAYDAITRLQLSYSMIPSRRGYDMLRATRETIEKPILRPILQPSQLTTMSGNSTVAEACELIVTHHVAAIVVVDNNGVIDGIFTCTDIVKRVVVANKDPQGLHIANVMTVNPDCASPDFTILDCLKRMQACGFRHLPVVEERTRVVVGLVDVLQLASDTLLDLNKNPSSPSSPSSPRRGSLRRSGRATSPASSRDSSRESNATISSQRNSGGGIGRGIVNFFGSLFSNSYAQRSDTASDRSRNRDPRDSLARGSRDIRGASRDLFRNDHRCEIPSSQTIPDMGVLPSTLSFSSSQQGRSFSTNSHSTLNNSESRGAPTRRHYGYLPPSHRGRSRHTRGDVPLASFKFKDINGDYRRIKVPMVLERGDYDQFVIDVRRRFFSSSSSASTTPSGAISIKYVDEDGDEVLIAHDDDLASCFEDVTRDRGRTIILKVRDDSGPKLQSPMSSLPSSAIGSPERMSVNSEPNDRPRSARDVPALSHPSPSTPPMPQGDVSMPRLKPSVEPPPLDEPLPERDAHRPSGVYRTNSKLKLHTPSTRKASDGHQMMLDKRIDEAIVLFTEALRLDEYNSRAMGERGAAHLLNGHPSEAEGDYRGALEMIEEYGKGGTRGDMTHQMCVVGLVEALIDMHRYEEAVEVANKMDPSWGNTGCMDALRDELDGASEAAKQALDTGNDYADALTCYNNALRVEMAYLKAVGHFEGNQNAADMARVSLRLGRAKCYAEIHDFDMALEDFDAAAKLNPESIAAYKGLAKCLRELEQLPKALEALEKAAGLDPGDEEIKNEIETIKKLLPDPAESKKAEIAKLGALLGGMNLPIKKAKK